jgi:hypothetical protein
MIESLILVPYDRASKAEVHSSSIELWPKKREAIKVSPDSFISHYVFKLKSKINSDSFRIIINDFETIELVLIEHNEGIYYYQSKQLKARSFLGFNLGLLELYLSDDIKKCSLTTLNNKQGLLQNDSIAYIYENVASSEFFSLYVSNYSRANNLSKLIESDETRKHFWLQIAVANQFLKEVQRFFLGEIDFISSVNNASEVRKYNSKSVVEDKDINWLMENPNEMFVSEFGSIPHLGLRYDIEFISQSILRTDFDNYENRLIISCLHSIKVSLGELLNEHSGNKLFPHKAIMRLIEKANDFFSNANSILNLVPPFNTRPEFSNKYLDDVRYVTLFGLISKWYSFDDLAHGDEIRSPILSITEIFEHYCFVKIVESFKYLGFTVDDLIKKDMDTAGTVVLRRGIHETLNIFYEPTVSATAFSPLKCSKKTSHYRPDLVLIYNNQDYMKCGVIDPKFSSKGIVNKYSAPEIFGKYGLYLHRPDGGPIDFVYAMYPDVSQNSTLDDYRHQLVSADVSPSLGYVSIPFNDNAAELMSGFLNSLITA